METSRSIRLYPSMENITELSKLQPTSMAATSHLNIAATSSHDVANASSRYTTTNSSFEGITDEEDSGPGYENPEKFFVILLPVIYSVVFIVGIIGNGSVIYIIHSKFRNRSITDMYVLNLAVADLVFVAMLPFWIVSIASESWPFGDILCKLTSSCTHFHMFASVFFLTAMSVDRFVAVVWYQKFRRTKTCARTTVITIWLMSMILGILPFIYRGVVTYDGRTKCIWLFNLSVATDQRLFYVYTTSRSVFGFLIPFLIIVISYSSLIVFLKSRETKGNLTGKRQDRATKMVLVVIAVFLVCWLPNQVSNLIYAVETLMLPASTELNMTHYYVHMVVTAIAWAHSCVNPILYAFMREDMRMKLAEIIHHHTERCCGDNSCIERQLHNRKASPEKDEMSRRKASRGLMADGVKEVRDADTASFRLTTVHKPSFDEPDAVDCERQPLTSGTSLKHRGVGYKQFKNNSDLPEEVLTSEICTAQNAATEDDSFLGEKSTYLSASLASDDAVEAKIQDAEETML